MRRRARAFLSNAKATKVLMAIQVGCMALFLTDILYEIHLSGIDRALVMSPVHLATEVGSLILLVSGFVIAHALLRQTRHDVEEKTRQLGSLRGHFDVILTDSFRAWGLSTAEADIALLSIRGLKISEIAQMRHTAEGTIKAQLSAVYRKSGIDSRTELLAHFMDEFLEYSANPSANEQDANTGKPKDHSHSIINEHPKALKSRH